MLEPVTTNRSRRLLPSMTIAIRALEASDLPTVDRILQAAFDRPYSFTPMLELNGAAQPGNQLVAVAKDRVVATVGAVDFGELAYVALMGVDPEYTRRGIARQMMAAVLARLDARGCPIVLLDATEAGAALYEQIGFVDDSSAYEYEGQWPVARRDAVLSARSRIAPLTVDDLDDVIAFDRPRFGADRGGLLRILLAQHREQAFVCRDAIGAVAGFLFARSVIGPWVARDTATADLLLQAASTHASPDPVRVLVPRSNEVACNLLERRGLRRVRTLRHMRRGGNGPPGEPACLFGQVSFGLG